MFRHKHGLDCWTNEHWLQPTPKLYFGTAGESLCFHVQARDKARDCHVSVTCLSRVHHMTRSRHVQASTWQIAGSPKSHLIYYVWDGDTIEERKIYTQEEDNKHKRRIKKSGSANLVLEEDDSGQDRVKVGREKAEVDAGGRHERQGLG